VRDLILSLREQGKTIFFSSHILSDVELLCDRAAILSRGSLIRCGGVHEMTEKESATVEVIAVGLDISRLAGFLEGLDTVQSLAESPNGIRLLLRDEESVDRALSLIRQAGGRLVSVNPQRVSLEDIFSRAEKG